MFYYIIYKHSILIFTETDEYNELSLKYYNKVIVKIVSTSYYLIDKK